MICLDSDCIIDFLKGKKESIEIIARHSKEIVTTEINKFEIMFGIYLKKEISEKEKDAAKSFFDSLDVLPFEKNCGEKAAQILASLSKEGNIIEQNDAFIASIMINNGIENILTKNEKHFLRIKGIKVMAY